MSNEIANIQPPSNHPTATTNILTDPAAFDHAQRVAKVFASSNLVPQHFRGNVADCLIALQIAHRLGEDPLTVMQSMYIVGGKPGFITAYMISRANKAGVFSGRITWDETGKGDTLAVTAKGVLSDTGEEVRVTCDMWMAKAEQWTRNAKYQSMPSHMLRWRSAAMLVRLYCPEVMLGMPLVEELETERPQEVRDVTPAKTAAKSLDDFAGSIEHMVTTSNGNDNGKDTSAAAGALDDVPEKTPTTPEEYRDAVGRYIETADNADMLETRWREDKQLRSRLGVPVSEAKVLGDAVLARVKELRG